MSEHAKNPFKPTAGASPPLLIGRRPILDGVAEAIDDGPGAPGRISIFTGARGVGKTVMLNEVEGVAADRGWITISDTATAGLGGRLEQEVARLVEERSPRRRRVTGITLPLQLGGVDADLPAEPPVALRRRLVELVDALARQGSGLIVTIDEVHRGAVDDLRDLAAITQHLVREDREFALVMAGLPAAVSSLLSDDVLTFLRRADKHVLSDVPVDEVRDALKSTIVDSGCTIADDALTASAEATGGYPFLVQLVGYHVWRSAETWHIGPDAARTGILAARRRLGSLVHETALQDLSDVDRTFLMVMSSDPDESRMRDIQLRMAVGPQYANTYKNRLVDAGIIRSSGHGRVAFALPYLREFLREHGATLGLRPNSNE